MTTDEDKSPNAKKDSAQIVKNLKIDSKNMSTPCSTLVSLLTLFTFFLPSNYLQPINQFFAAVPYPNGQPVKSLAGSL